MSRNVGFFQKAIAAPEITQAERIAILTATVGAAAKNLETAAADILVRRQISRLPHDTGVVATASAFLDTLITPKRTLKARAGEGTFAEDIFATLAAKDRLPVLSEELRAVADRPLRARVEVPVPYNQALVSGRADYAAYLFTEKSALADLCGHTIFATFHALIIDALAVERKMDPDALDIIETASQDELQRVLEDVLESLELTESRVFGYATLLSIEVLAELLKPYGKTLKLKVGSIRDLTVSKIVKSQVNGKINKVMESLPGLIKSHVKDQLFYATMAHVMPILSDVLGVLAPPSQLSKDMVSIVSAMPTRRAEDCLAHLASQAYRSRLVSSVDSVINLAQAYLSEASDRRAVYVAQFLARMESATDVAAGNYYTTPRELVYFVACCRLAVLTFFAQNVPALVGPEWDALRNSHALTTLASIEQVWSIGADRLRLDDLGAALRPVMIGDMQVLLNTAADASNTTGLREAVVTANYIQAMDQYAEKIKHVIDHSGGALSLVSTATLTSDIAVHHEAPRNDQSHGSDQTVSIISREVPINALVEMMKPKQVSKNVAPNDDLVVVRSSRSAEAISSVINDLWAAPTARDLNIMHKVGDVRPMYGVLDRDEYLPSTTVLSGIGVNDLFALAQHSGIIRWVIDTHQDEGADDNHVYIAARPVLALAKISARAFFQPERRTEGYLPLLDIESLDSILQAEGMTKSELKKVKKFNIIADAEPKTPSYAAAVLSALGLSLPSQAAVPRIEFQPVNPVPLSEVAFKAGSIVIESTAMDKQRHKVLQSDMRSYKRTTVLQLGSENIHKFVAATESLVPPVTSIPRDAEFFTAGGAVPMQMIARTIARANIANALRFNAMRYTASYRWRAGVTITKRPEFADDVNAAQVKFLRDYGRAYLAEWRSIPTYTRIAELMRVSVQTNVPFEIRDYLSHLDDAQKGTIYMTPAAIEMVRLLEEHALGDVTKHYWRFVKSSQNRMFELILDDNVSVFKHLIASYNPSNMYTPAVRLTAYTEAANRTEIDDNGGFEAFLIEVAETMRKQDGAQITIGDALATIQAFDEVY